MARYITFRLFGLIPVLLIISLLVFLVTALIPGNAAMILAGEEATREDIKKAEIALGLDKPIHQRYFWWMGQIVQGDLGNSWLSKKPVLDDILHAIPVTLELTILGLGLGTLIAFPVGVISALNHGRTMDKVMFGVLLTSISVPAFWSALMLILLFSLWLRVLPPSGYVPIAENILGNLERMILPVLSVGAFQAGVNARFVRSGMLEVLGQDYIRTARSKGLLERHVVMGHAFKNMLIPVVTFLGIQLGGLLGGLVITEEVFALPGIGRLALNAVFNRDIPVIQGVVLFVAVAYVLINLLVDVIYAFLNPRIRYGHGQ